MAELETKKWHELYKIKEIAITVITVAGAGIAILNWVDSRYASSETMTRELQTIKLDVEKSKCTLTSLIVELSTTTLIDKKKELLDQQLKRLIDLQGKDNPNADEKFEMFKIQNEIANLQSLIQSLELTDLSSANSCPE